MALKYYFALYAKYWFALYVGLLLVSIGLLAFAANSNNETLRTAATVVTGMFGLAGAAGGVILFGNIDGSVDTMRRWETGLRSAVHLPTSPTFWRSGRIAGTSMIVVGALIAIVSWSGQITWKS